MTRSGLTLAWGVILLTHGLVMADRVWGGRADTAYGAGNGGAAGGTILIAALADGDAAMDRGDYPAAVRHYRAELKLHPESYDVKFKLARALAFSGHREEAIGLYTELLTTRPTNSDVLLARGRVYTWENRWREAEADLTAVTTRLPNYGEAWSALGDVYLRSGRPAKAVQAYGKWIGAGAQDPLAYIARARAHRAAGNVAAARVDFEAARERGGPDAEVGEYLASLDPRRRDPESVAPDEYRWFGRLSSGISDFSPDRGTWRNYSLLVRRYWQRASLGVELLRAERFDQQDQALALDAYVDLWPRSYANLRYQYSRAAVLYPDNSYRIEVFQGVGQGWELSASYDHLSFDANSVALYGAGFGKYTGNWYLRWKTLFIPSSARSSLSHRVLSRYYYAGNGDDYVELNAGFGRGGEFIPGTTVVDATSSRSVGLAFQTYPHPRWGLTFSAGYDSDRDSFVERSLSAGVLARW
ncbi:MAG: YaiO family outer membrane beta-barrel protein [Nitrospirota bacterium]